MEFSQNGNLRTHMNTHSDREKAEKFTCKYCGKVFTHKQYFKTHIRYHEGEQSTYFHNKKRQELEFFNEFVMSLYCKSMAKYFFSPKKWFHGEKNTQILSLVILKTF